MHRGQLLVLLFAEGSHLLDIQLMQLFARNHFVLLCLVQVGKVNVVCTVMFFIS